MIDYLKMICFDKESIEDLKQNSELIWCKEVQGVKNYQTGEIFTTVFKEVDGIVFKFFHNKLEIILKPHYLYNHNQHNANDLHIEDGITILSDVIFRFRLEPQQWRIVNIEYGLNIETTICVKYIMDSLAYHQKNEFITDRDHVYSKKSSRITANNKFSDYKLIKSYAKSIQFPQYVKGNVWRLEIKSKKSRYINELGIFTLRDLLIDENYLPLKDAIEEEFEKLLFLDRDIIQMNFDKREKVKLKNWNESNSWKSFKLQSRNTFLNNKNRYEKLLNKEPSNLKTKLRSEVHKKTNKLFCAKSQVYNVKMHK